MVAVESLINQIIEADCEEVLAQLPDKCVDFSFADPPYGVQKAVWDCSYPQYHFEAALLRLSRAGVCVTPGQEQIAECITRMGAAYQGLHVGRNLNGMTFNKLGFENTIIAVVGGCALRGPSFFEFCISGDKEPHPSPKPIKYMFKLLSRFTKRGDLVLDPYSGSGTTAIACHMLDRRFICIEREHEYVEISRNRLKEAVAQQSLFDNAHLTSGSILTGGRCEAAGNGEQLSFQDSLTSEQAVNPGVSPAN